MKRRSAAVSLALVVLLLALPARGGSLAATYRLGVPKGCTSPVYPLLFEALRTRGLAAGEVLVVVPIDLQGSETEPGQQRIRREIAQGCDLFFSTGDALSSLFAAGITTPLLFVTSSTLKTMLPAAMRPSATGIFRESTAALFQQMLDLLPADQRRKLGMLYFQGSPMASLAALYEEASREIGVGLEQRTYGRRDEIGQAMRELQERGVNAVVLFPPSLMSGDLPELIHWQHRLGLPVMGQVREEIEQGLLGGPSLDYDRLVPHLMEYALAILRGRSPEQLPIKYLSGRLVINLATARTLGVAIPQETADQAELVGLATQTRGRAAEPPPLVPGNFRIAVPASTPGPTLAAVTAALVARGYAPGQNLTLVRIDLDGVDTPEEQRRVASALTTRADLVFATGNSLPVLARLPDLATPVCFIAAHETTALRPGRAQDLFTGVVRGSFGAFVEKCQRMMRGATRMGILARIDSDLGRRLDEYRQVASPFGVTIQERLFSEVSGIGPAMAGLRDTCDFVFAFPPALTREDVAEIVVWQHRLGLPVLAQHEEHVQAGLLGGAVMDLEMVAPKVAEYIDKILQGRPPSRLPVYHYPERSMLNLRAVQLLGQDIPPEITAEAAIVR
ncbi:MAG: ABC transporter substrate binding protein [Thermodesulfobacteriota bacterium]